MDSPPSLASAIRARAHALGFDLVGIAAADPFAREQELILQSHARGRLAGMAWITPERIRLACDPPTLLPGVRSIIALGTAYGGGREEARGVTPSPQPSPRGRGSQSQASPRGGGSWPPAGATPPPPLPLPASPLALGRVARYAWGRDYHDVIPPRLRSLAETIVELSGAETRCRSFVDTGPLVDRAAAARAGIGFVGKNTCILTGHYGSFVFLSAILTTAALPTDPMATRDCGSCRACLDACPTDAFVGARQLDATRCISYLTIEHRGPIPGALRPLMGDWVFGCDVCQDVCPWNRARGGAGHDEFRANEGAGSTLDLVELLSLDNAGFRTRFRGTPLTRAKRRGLLRNAAVALGNLRDRQTIPALVAALADPEPLVRGHAAWALGQFAELPPQACNALETALTVEPDAEVGEELRAALEATRKERTRTAVPGGDPGDAP